VDPEDPPPVKPPRKRPATVMKTSRELNGCDSVKHSITLAPS